MTLRNQHIGKEGEERAANALRSKGVEMVEKIGTPVRIVPGRAPLWGEKVSGDHRGVLPGGTSVLAETKTIMDRNLVWSNLREHQPGRLTRHAELGGISLLVWVHSTGVYVMLWPVEGFGPRKSISPDRASELAIQSITPVRAPLYNIK